MKSFIKSLFPAVLSLLIISCGGGGSSSGGSTGGQKPQIPSYLKVTSVSPQNAATNVKFNAPIYLNFNESVDASTFVNTDAQVGSLMAAKGLSVLLKEDFSEVSSSELQSLSLDDFASGDYIITSNPEDQESYDPIVGFEINHNSMTRTLVLSSLGLKEFVFSHRELKETGLFDQNMIVITNQDGEELKGRLISDLVLDRVEFLPFGYLDYEDTYTITVNKNLTSTQNNSMQSGYSASFTVEDLPNIEYVSYGPTGIDNNPLDDIVIEVNFNLDSDVDLDSAVQVFKVTGSGSEETEKIQLTSKALSENKREIRVSLDGYWKHDSKYRVKVLGEYLTGTVGSSGPLSLAGTDLDWSFNTSSPKVIYTYPGMSSERSVETYFYVGFNFPVSPSELSSKIRLEDELGNVHAYEVSNSASVTGRYIFKPSQNLPFNEKMKVVVASGVTSSLDASVKTAEQSLFEFQTEKKAIGTLDPYDGENGVSATTNIQISFNFPVEVNPNTYIKLTQIHDGITTPLDYQHSFSNNNKTIELRPRYSGSDYDFLFNATVYVQILAGVAGDDLAGMQDLSYQFRVENQELVISSSTPFDGAALVPVNDTSVSVTFNYDVFDDPSIENPLSIDYNCDGYTGTIEEGTYTVSGKTVYFDPSYSALPDSSYFGSGCDHTIVVDTRLSGMQGQAFESNTDTEISFTTDWLDVDEIFVEYAYDNRIRVDSEFELDFTHDISYGFSDSNFDIVPTYDDVYVPPLYTSRWNDEITVEPAYDLNFGEEYTLWVYQDPEYSYQSPVRSTTGERLIADHYYTFVTENMPLDVDYYSPYGDYVSVDSYIYLDMNYNHFDQGFPAQEDVYFEISAYYYDYVTESYQTYYYSADEFYIDFNFDDIDIYTDYQLFYDAEYEITGYFTFADGEQVSFSWDFSTEQDPYTGSTGGASVANKPAKRSVSVASMSKDDKEKLKKAQKGTLASLSKNFKKESKKVRAKKRVESSAKMQRRTNGSSSSRLDRANLVMKNKASKLSRKSTKSRM